MPQAKAGRLPTIRCFTILRGKSGLGVKRMLIYTIDEAFPKKGRRVMGSPALVDHKHNFWDNSDIFTKKQQYIYYSPTFPLL